MHNIFKKIKLKMQGVDFFFQKYYCDTPIAKLEDMVDTYHQLLRRPVDPERLDWFREEDTKDYYQQMEKYLEARKREEK